MATECCHKHSLPQGDFELLTAKSELLGDPFPHGQAGAGQHWCALFHNAAEHKQLTIDFMVEGIRDNDMMGYFMDAPRQQKIIDDFLSVGVDLQPLIDRGQFKFYCADEIYFIDGLFDYSKTIQLLKDATTAARKAGYNKYRATGEMAWAMRQHLLPDLFHYEAQLADFFNHYPCVALCQYDMNVFDATSLLSVLSTHPKAIIGTEQYDNFYYMPAAEFLVGDLPGSTLNHWIKNLKLRKRMEAKLQRKNEELCALNHKLQTEVEERKKMETAKQEAETLSKMKSDFLGVVSHEIRTPLNGIVCMTNMLSENTTLTPEQKEFVGVIEVSSDHLMTVLNDILDFSKIESDKLQLEAKPFSLYSCVNGVVDMFRAREKKVIIRHSIESGLPLLIVGDVTRLRQVLFNLLSNAIKFTPQDGSVELRVRPAPSSPPTSPSTAENSSENSTANSPNNCRDTDTMEILFSVKDTGIGIPKEKWNCLFFSFSQADSSITRKYGGTGLGLAISKKLVELMGGSIWFDSKVGVGSTFSFTINTKIPKPQQAKQPDHTLLSSQSSTNSAPHKSQQGVREKWSEMKILVAEDNPINQRVMKHIMQRLKYNIVIANNGKEAVDLVKKQDFQLIFMDLLMPEMGGIEATNHILSMDWSCRKKPVVVAMTASASQADKEMCHQAGMEYHLAKPLRIEELTKVLEKIEQGKKLIIFDSLDDQ